MIMEEMSSTANNLFMWVEFLLDKKRLKQHLTQEHPDPSATTLLTQFIINADRAIHLSNGGAASNGNGNGGTPAAAITNSTTTAATTNNSTTSNHTPTPPPPSENSEDGSAQALTAEQLAAACRARKTRSLVLMAMQVAAHLGWDLDSLSRIPIVLQHSLMKHMLSLVNAENDKGNKPSERSKEFLRVLYHRWVLRMLNNHNPVNRASKSNNVVVPGAEHFNTPLTIDAVVKLLNEEESAQYLKNFFSNQSVFAKAKDFRVPNFDTFADEKDPDWSVGSVMSRAAFESLVHFELSVYWLYKGNVTEASQHFKSQKSKPEQYAPYLKISAAKIDGYKKALGQIVLTKTDETYKTPSLNYNNVAEMAKLMRKGQVVKLKKFIAPTDDSGEPPRKLEKLSADKIEYYEGSLLATGDEKLAISVFEGRLIETSEVNVMKECLTNLTRLSGGNAGASGLYSKLFSGWELPIPVHHAILNIAAGPFLDFIYVLVAKSRQLLTINMFSEAREMLVAASLELGSKLKQSLRSGRGMDPFFYNISKLTKMLEWEILLIDINQFYVEYESGGKNASADLIRRCKDCLDFLRDQNNEVNPRSEIVENILMTLINVGEYHLVVHYDKSQSQRYPFLDFLTLLARVCNDLFVDRKDISSNYRELWSAVLPLFSSYNMLTGTVMVGSVISGNSKKLGSSSLTSSKPAILSSRHLLLWVIDRSCSQNLISVWVSLLARLHNHILDDVGLQIITEYLHIWPNILDDVTAGIAAGIQDNKVSRVAGSSKLNSRHIRDFLFHILQKALLCTSGAEMIAWLRCLGDVHLAAAVPSSAMKCYIEYLAIGTEFFEKHNSSFWADNNLFKRMIKCCELMGAHTQAVILCQFLTEVDYSMAFGKAQEKITSDASDALYGFIWDLTILEFLINLHSKRNETTKRQEAIKVMGLLELNSNNNEEIQREAMYLRKSQFMRTLAKQYVFL